MFMPFKNRIVLRIDMYPRSLRQIIKIKNVNSMKGYFKMDIKLQNNRPIYSNTVIGTLAVDGWAVTFGTARSGLGGLRPRPVHSPLYQM